MDTRKRGGHHLQLMQLLHTLGYTPDLIKIIGYSDQNRQREESDRYAEAKRPVKDWKIGKNKVIAIRPEEIAPWNACGGWLGMVIPDGLVALDIDNDSVGKAIHDGLKSARIKHIAIKTPNGWQFICLASTRVVKQRARMITLAGLVADYRIAGKGYIVLPTQNTQNRSVVWADTALSPMPLLFSPVRSFNSGKDANRLLSVPIIKGQRNDTMFRHQCRIRQWNKIHKMGLTAQDMNTIALEMNDIFCKPPLTVEEVKGIMHSADSYGSGVQDKEIEEIGAQDIIGDYFVRDGYLWKRMTGRGEEGDTVDKSMRLCNFDVRIKRRIKMDDGINSNTKILLGGRLLPDIELPQLEIPAANLHDIRKWIHEFNKNMVIEPGYNTKDIVRHAIEVRSTDAVETVVFSHTGWLQIAGDLHYLTAGGSLFAPEIRVKISDERYNLPNDNAVDEIEAIKTSLSFLNVAKKEISLPLLIFSYLSTLTTMLGISPGFTAYLSGGTGKYKTSLALLAQCHFGDFTNPKDLANFRDTLNSIEKRAFTLKDALMIIDDFHPSTDPSQAVKMEQLAQLLVRVYGNRTARGRLNPDTSDKGRYVPRGLLIMTGEEIMSLPSSLARIMLLEVKAGTIDRLQLSAIQKKAFHLPYSMASFIKWEKQNMKAILKQFDEMFYNFRDTHQSDGHSRQSEQVAFLVFMSRIVATWLTDKGVFGQEDAELFCNEAHSIFRFNAEKLNGRIRKEDPADNFMENLRALIVQGKVRIEHIRANDRNIGGPYNVIGYHDDKDAFLLSTSVFHEVKNYLVQEREHLPFSKNVMLDMLKSRKHITSYNVQKKVRGKVLKCMVIPLQILMDGISNSESQ